MKTKKRSRKSEDFATGVGRALRLAVKDARKTARMYVDLRLRKRLPIPMFLNSKP